MQLISLQEAEILLKELSGNWIYVKFLSNTYAKNKTNEAVMYNKFKVKQLYIFDDTILIHGKEDDDRLVISKNTLVQSECTPNRDEMKLTQQLDNTVNEFFLKSYLPTAERRLDEISNYNRNIIITEGQTDWKHLINALQEFQRNGQYLDLDFDFFEYNEEINMGNDKLLKVCEYQALFHNDFIKVFLFDSDTEKFNKIHENQNFINYGNNVYSLILPIPEHRKENPLISIEHYYTDKEIKTLDNSNRRLYMVNEFDPKSYQHLTEVNLYCLDIKNKENNLIIDDKVFKVFSDESIAINNLYNYPNKKNVALSKNDFAFNILNKIPPFDKVSYQNFSILFDLLLEIQKDSQSLSTPQIEISEGIYLEQLNDKSILNIYYELDLENAMLFKTANTIHLTPILSEDKTTLFLVIQINEHKYHLPILISEDFIDFIINKSLNFSNRIELHIFTEGKHISSKELFQGHNSSSTGMSIILRELGLHH
ncbi:hypothetical protein MKZ20_14790 [Psychrobacillus sp. FSL K6-2684]|uniref:hypothetical protein n=1 Tax=Psychrobacillus sp. FSL K6-2684 TaxID=2921547 RepID=UPI0030F8B765